MFKSKRQRITLYILMSIFALAAFFFTLFWAKYAQEASAMLQADLSRQHDVFDAFALTLAAVVMVVLPMLYGGFMLLLSVWILFLIRKTFRSLRILLFISVALYILYASVLFIPALRSGMSSSLSVLFVVGWPYLLLGLHWLCAICFAVSAKQADSGTTQEKKSLEEGA